jgi:hypothetical protein
MRAANWTQHRKLGGSSAAEASTASKSKLVWRSLDESPAAVVSDEADENQRPVVKKKPIKSAPKQVAGQAGGATRLRVQVQNSKGRPQQAQKARRSAVVRVAHEGDDDGAVIQLAQDNSFDPFGNTPAEEPLPTDDGAIEPLDDSPLPESTLPEGDDPAPMTDTETLPADPIPDTTTEPAAETPTLPADEEPAAPAADTPPPETEPYDPGASDIGTLAPQAPQDDQDDFPTNQLPGDLCANGKYGCRQALQILQGDTLAKVGPGIALSGAEGVNFPCVCPLEDEQYAGRAWGQTCFEWKASALCHKPLYFEEVGLERYGHAVVLQPAVSAARFFATVPLLPYEMGMRPPWECVYPLGHYRPGSCAPYYIPPVPVSLRGGLMEAGVVTGLVYIIP